MKITLTYELQLPPSPSPEQASPAKSESFTVHAACGPFTTDSDLQFKPWRALVQKFNTEKPQVLLVVTLF